MDERHDPPGHDPRTKAYLARRTAEGKTTKEIIRCLKRYIAREIYKALRRPQQPGRPPRHTPAPNGGAESHSH